MKNLKQKRMAANKPQNVTVFTEMAKAAKRAPELVEFVGPTVMRTFWLLAVVGVMVFVAKLFVS